MGQREYLTEFSTDKNIGSVTQEEVQKRLAQLWEKLEFPELEMSVCYTRDKDALNRNLQEYISYQQTTNSEYRPDYVFTEDDEDYLIYYRQQLDGIPLANRHWVKQNGSSTATTFAAEYSPLYGLTYLQVSNLFNVKEKLPAVEIASAEKALDAYRKEYDKSIHFQTTEIAGIELCYVVVNDLGVLTAKPAWILTILNETETADSDIRTYEITAIDAQSLEFINSAVVLQNIICNV